ncbi:MAG: response regulator [Actinomycetota bacterium]
MKKASIKVMLVDDHEIVRAGIRALLESAGGLKVVAEAGTVDDAVAGAAETLPDVVVMDVRLAEESGIEATREIRSLCPETAVLMLTSFADDEALVASIVAGTSGYVLKQIRGGDIVDSVRAVAAGKSLLDPAVTRAVMERIRSGKHLTGDERLDRLSPQEERVLTMIAQGKTNREIARVLGLAEKTVKNYVSSILLKLDVRRRAEAAAYLAGRRIASGA